MNHVLEIARWGSASFNCQVILLAQFRVNWKRCITLRRLFGSVRYIFNCPPDRGFPFLSTFRKNKLAFRKKPSQNEPEIMPRQTRVFFFLNVEGPYAGNPVTQGWRLEEKPPAFSRNPPLNEAKIIPRRPPEFFFLRV